MWLVLVAAAAASQQFRGGWGWGSLANELEAAVLGSRAGNATHAHALGERAARVRASPAEESAEETSTAEGTWLKGEENSTSPQPRLIAVDALPTSPQPTFVAMGDILGETTPAPPDAASKGGTHLLSAAEATALAELSVKQSFAAESDAAQAEDRAGAEAAEALAAKAELRLQAALAPRLSLPPFVPANATTERRAEMKRVEKYAKRLAREAKLTSKAAVAEAKAAAKSSSAVTAARIETEAAAQDAGSWELLLRQRALAAWGAKAKAELADRERNQTWVLAHLANAAEEKTSKLLQEADAVLDIEPPEPYFSGSYAQGLDSDAAILAAR